MKFSKQENSHSYCLDILIDGAVPFLFRKGVRSLLGFPERAEGSIGLNPRIPPSGFRYANPFLVEQVYPPENSFDSFNAKSDHSQPKFEKKATGTGITSGNQSLSSGENVSLTESEKFRKNKLRPDDSIDEFAPTNPIAGDTPQRNGSHDYQQKSKTQDFQSEHQTPAQPNRQNMMLPKLEKKQITPTTREKSKNPPASIEDTSVEIPGFTESKVNFPGKDISQFHKKVPSDKESMKPTGSQEISGGKTISQQAASELFISSAGKMIKSLDKVSRQTGGERGSASLLPISKLEQNAIADDMETIQSKSNAGRIHSFAYNSNNEPINIDRGDKFRHSPISETEKQNSAEFTHPVKATVPLPQLSFSQFLNRGSFLYNDNYKNASPFFQPEKNGNDVEYNTLKKAEGFPPKSLVYRSHNNAAKKIVQLEHTVNQLTMEKNQLTSQIRVNNSQSQLQQSTIPSVNEIIHVNRPTKRSRTRIFWERRYLGRFHFKTLR